MINFFYSLMLFLVTHNIEFNKEVNMRIYQNEQIGDIYRRRRGKLADAIENFNLTIKNARISVI